MTEHRIPTLLNHFLHWEATQGSEIYLTQPFPDGSVVDYSWAEVGNQARRMAAYLQTMDLPAGSHIGLLGKNSAHWIMADLAIWMAGHVSVPLYPTLNAETAAYVLDHSEIKLLFVGKMDAESWSSLKAGVPAELPLITMPLAPELNSPQWGSIVAGTAPLQNIHQPQPNDLATIIYTSGSTGRPKGVMHSHRAMSDSCKASHEVFGAGNADRMLSYLPLAHAAERAIVEANSLYNGFRVYFSDSLETFAEDLRRARPTIFFSVPRLWTKFYQGVTQKLPAEHQALLATDSPAAQGLKKAVLTQLGLQDTRVAPTGSAPLPENIVIWYRNLGLEMLDCYGMSENFATSHLSRPGQVRIGYVGSTVPGVEARISESGELEVKSLCQMLGYYKNPQASFDDMTADGFFKTGDRGEIDELGRLKITGRVKDLFKTSKGKYVAPLPIEQTLGNHPALEQVCVAGSGQAQPFALLMLSPGAQQSLASADAKDTLAADLEKLRLQVNEALEAHEKIEYFVILSDLWSMDNGMLTPTMKIKRNVIEARYAAEADAWAKLGQSVIWQ